MLPIIVRSNIRLSIDSITWQREKAMGSDFMRIHVDHVRRLQVYYQWKYEETWEIHSAYYTSIEYVRDYDKNQCCYRTLVFQDA